MQQSLFPNDEPIIQPKEAIVKIEKSKQPLTKNQIAFNKLTEDIRKITIDIKKTETHMDLVSAYFNENMMPTFTLLAERKLTFAKKLFEALSKIKALGKNVKSYVKGYILDELKTAFAITQPSEEDLAFAHKVAGNSTKEAKKIDDEEKQQLVDMVFEQFGIKLDIEDVGNTPEQMEEMMRKVQEQIFEKTNQKSSDDWYENEKKNTKKKSKKKLAAEAKEKEEENVVLKSVRSVYLALVKLLHPDTETDENLKLEKEEIMKQVTVAYEAKDLATLLKIEMQWVTNAHANLQTLTDEKLALYNKALREQLNELKFEKREIVYHPKYHRVREYANTDLVNAKRKINHFKSELEESIKEMEKDEATLGTPQNKKLITAIAKRFQEEEMQRAFMGFYDEDDDDDFPF
jgi:hypothetical protein